MRRCLTAVTVALGALVLLAGCGGHEDSDFFPLVAGAERTMRITTRVSEGDSTRESVEVRLVERVRGEVEMAGVGRVWVVETPRDPGEPALSYFRRTEDAVLQVVAGRDSLPVEYLYLSLPLTPGLRWYDTERQDQVSEVVARDTLVVGDDTFPDCFEVLTRSTRGDWSVRQWLAPDVGAVLWEQRSSTEAAGGRQEMWQRGELVSYTRPKRPGPIP